MAERDQPRVVGGRYELAERIHDGRLASVFRGHDLHSDRVVAVKVFDQATGWFREELGREASAVRSLPYDASVVSMLDYRVDTSVTSPAPFVVTEYVAGQSVRDLLSGGHQLSPEQALGITSSVLRALTIHHAAGHVHMDVQPGAVLVTPVGAAKLLSFGKFRTDPGEDYRSAGWMVRGYPPEALPGGGGMVDARADLYSTGSLLYEMLAGRPPFPARDGMDETIQQIQNGALIPLSVLPDVPSWADPIVAKAMAKDPKDRYQSAREMLAAIQAIQHEMAMSRPARPGRTAAGSSDRGPWGVFISYRREDAAPYARLLQLQMREEVPEARVFMDLDSIEPGLDFADVIKDALGSCAILIALIGRQWATIGDEEGRRRLDDPDDFVRFEVQTALERGVRVIPVLVDGARPLRQQQLPEGLGRLARLNALELSYGRYDYDAERLIGIIRRVLEAHETAGHGGPPGRRPAGGVEPRMDPFDSGKS